MPGRGQRVVDGPSALGLLGGRRGWLGGGALDEVDGASAVGREGKPGLCTVALKLKEGEDEGRGAHQRLCSSNDAARSIACLLIRPW